ncbi:MAG: hypothetical protein ABI638_09535 [Ignavibacteriota bacterium]
MESYELIVDEIENQSVKEPANIDSETAGLNSDLQKDDNNVFIIFSNEDNCVQFVIPDIIDEKIKVPKRCSSFFIPLID